MEVIRRWSWVLGFAGVLALGGGAIAWWLLGEVDRTAQGFFASGGLGVLAWALLDRERLREGVQTRQFAYSAGSALLQALVLLIAVVGFVLAERHDRTWDLTREKEHTLSDHTLGVLAGLREPVKLMAFFRNGTVDAQSFERLARRYDDASDLLTVEWVDPLTNPLKAEQYEVQSEYGTVVLIQGDRKQRLEGEISEEDLTRELVVVQSTEDHRVCWALGHGEADPDDEFSPDGLGGVVLALEGGNYQVTKSLIATEGIDRACEALVVARPRTEWLPFEREALAAYLAEGGRVLILLDPGDVPDFAADLDRFAIGVGEDVVLDVDPRNTMMGVGDPSFPVLSGQGLVHHAITRDLAAAVVLGVARSVSIRPDAEGLTAQELLRTSEAAWAETDLEGDPEPNEGSELVGEVPVAAVVEVVDPSVLKVAPPSAAPVQEAGSFDPMGDVGRAVPVDFAPKPGGRLVVVGDTDFASNQLLALGNNRDLFLNAIAWLVDEEDQIGARPKVGESLEISALESGLLCVVSVILVPGAAAMLAAFTLLRRRFL